MCIRDRNYTPPTHNIKQNTAVNNACDVQKEQHTERNVRDTNRKKKFSIPYDRTVSTMQSKRESADEEIKEKQQQVHVQPSCSRDTKQ